MSYTDPQSVTVSAVAKTLNRVPSSSPTRSNVYADAPAEFKLETKQDVSNNRFRHEVRLTQKKVAADPISTLNKEISASVFIVIDEPRWGFTDTELAAITTSLMTWFTAANRDKLLGGEL